MSGIRSGVPGYSALPCRVQPRRRHHCEVLFCSKDELPTKVGVRGLSKDTPLEEIVKTFKEMEFPAMYARPIPPKRFPPGTLFHLKVAHLGKDELKSLYDIAEVLNIPGITIEAWHGKVGPPSATVIRASGTRPLIFTNPGAAFVEQVRIWSAKASAKRSNYSAPTALKRMRQTTDGARWLKAAVLSHHCRLHLNSPGNRLHQLLNATHPLLLLRRRRGAQCPLML